VIFKLSKISSNLSALLFLALTACATSDVPVSSGDHSFTEVDRYRASSETDSLDWVEVPTGTGMQGSWVRLDSKGRLSKAKQLIRAAENDRANDTNEVVLPEQVIRSLSGFSTGTSYRMTLADTLFAVNSTKLLPEASNVITKAIEYFDENDVGSAVIEGHTDNTGSHAFNAKQSRGRALSVRDALVKAGMDSENLSIRALGDDAPVSDNETAEGRRLNRRVDIVFVK